MKQIEKIKLEEVYSYIFQYKPHKALNILNEIIQSDDYSEELNEIALFKIADIQFQEKQYKEAQETFLLFTEKYHCSHLNKIVELRLEFIKKMLNVKG